MDPRIAELGMTALNLPTTSLQVQQEVKAEVLRLAKALDTEIKRLRLLTEALMVLVIVIVVLLLIVAILG